MDSRVLSWKPDLMGRVVPAEAVVVERGMHVLRGPKIDTQVF